MRQREDEEAIVKEWWDSYTGPELELHLRVHLFWNSCDAFMCGVLHMPVHALIARA